jgi:hypothetical protein
MTSVLAIFALVFAALTAGGMWAVGNVPAVTARWGPPPPLPPQPGEDWYIAYDQDNVARDHYVMYTGYGPAIAYAKGADAVIVGDSRSQIGFLREELAAYTEREGVRFYNMSLGFFEGDPFFTEVIRRQDLRPRYLIVNVDVSQGNFFRAEPSALGKKILAGGGWTAQKYIYGRYMSDIVESTVQKAFPYYPGPKQGTVMYRSWSNGFWNRDKMIGYKGPYPVKPFVDTQSADERAEEQQRARVFAREMEARGSRVVFTWVPASYMNRDRAKAIAEAAGVPFISPDLEGLATIDEGHLDGESAERFSIAFLDEFNDWRRTRE